MENKYSNKPGDFIPCSFVSPSIRPSFREAISRAERQVEADCIDEDKELVHEICAIIAEVYMMKPDNPIRISGEWLDGYLVKEVFGELTDMHVRMVIEEFERLTTDIRNKKAYLRTSLYNSVFSLSANYTNRINHELKGVRP